MSYLRPEVKMTLQEYYQMTWNPGMREYYTNVLKLTPEEFEQELNDWKRFLSENIPEAFPGMKELLVEFKQRGGKIAVVSRNRKEHILRDFEANGLPVPDLIYGSEHPAEEQKPSPYPIWRIMKKLNVKKEEILVLDDLPLGEKMAEAAGVDFCYADWSHHLPNIEEYMKAKSLQIFKSPAEFAAFLLK